MKDLLPCGYIVVSAVAVVAAVASAAVVVKVVIPT
jgi:hypothetical protein